MVCVLLLVAGSLYCGAFEPLLSFKIPPCHVICVADSTDPSLSLEDLPVTVIIPLPVNDYHSNHCSCSGEDFVGCVAPWSFNVPGTPYIISDTQSDQFIAVGPWPRKWGVLYSTRYDWSLYLVKEIRDVVDVVVDHHPDVVVCLVRGHLGQRVVLDLVSHFSRKNNTIRTNQKRITVRKFCGNLNCARTWFNV